MVLSSLLGSAVQAENLGTAAEAAQNVSGLDTKFDYNGAKEAISSLSEDEKSQLVKSLLKGNYTEAADLLHSKVSGKNLFTIAADANGVTINGVSLKANVVHADDFSIGEGDGAVTLSAAADQAKKAESALAAYKAAGIEAGSVQYDNNNIAIGKGSSITGKSMGATARNVVLGTGSTLDNQLTSGEGHTTIVGADSTVKNGSGVTAIGGKTNVTKNASFSTAVGYNSSVDNQMGTAIGYQSQTSVANAAVAIGAKSSSSASYSVALGSERTAVKDDTDKTDKRGVISVGKSGDGGFTRRIVNVSDGIRDNDAVNKKQLDAVSDRLSGFTDLAVTYTDSTKTAVDFKGAALENVGDISFKLKGNTRGLLASGIAPGAVYSAASGWAEGAAADTASLAIGGGLMNSQTSSASVRGKNSIAIGSGAKVDTQGVDAGVSINAFDKADSVAVGVGATVTGIQGTAVGYGAAVKGNQSAAYGDQSRASADKASAFGENAQALAVGAVALGQNASVGMGADNSVALGAGSAVFSSDLKGSYGVVSMGRGNDTRRLIHVADGIDDSDAVTMGQLKKVTGIDVTRGDVVQYDGNNLYAGKEGSGKLALDAGNGSAQISSASGNSAVRTDDDSAVLSHAGENATSQITASTEGAAISYTGTNAAGETVTNRVTVSGNGTTVDGDLHVNGNFSINGKYIATADQVENLSGDLNGMKGQIGANEDGTYKTIEVKDKNGNAVTNLTDAVNANAEKISANGAAIEANSQKIGDTSKLKDVTGKDGATLTDAALANHNAITAETADRKAADDQIWKGMDSLGTSVSRLGQEIDTVGAVSAALAGLHPIDDGGASRLQLATAVGTYDGTQALALGGFYNLSPNVRLSLGVSTSLNGSDRKTAGNLGATFLIGPGVSKSMFASGDSALAGEISDLKSQNKDQKEQIQKQQKELEDLKHMIEQLMKK